MMPTRKKRAAGKSPRAVRPVETPVAAPVEAPVVCDTDETPHVPGPPARGMTTEQIRRVGNRIAEHERDLKSSTSRR
jgi:hypothetical protein